MNGGRVRKVEFDPIIVGRLKELSKNRGLTVTLFLLIDEVLRTAILATRIDDFDHIAKLSRLIAGQA